MSSFGKKTRNPGYKSGDNWLLCDTCGFTVHASKAKHTWDGLIVCPEDYEPRNEQDFVRSLKDKITPNTVRPEGVDVTADNKECATRTAVAGNAVTGCALAGVLNFITNTIPSGTFNPDTL